MKRDIIVIGAPVGGGSSLIRLVELLPGDLCAAVFVVLHTTPENPILLADVLTRPGRMRVTEAVNGDQIEPNHIYVAADGKHLILQRNRVRLRSDPSEGTWRPSIDVLFRSAAAAHRDRVIGVILLHAREDGILGLHAIRQNGGRAVTHRNEQMPEGPCHPETGEELAHDHLDLDKIAPRIIGYVNGANGNGLGPPSAAA